jgi:hypothetical protein
MAVAGEALSRNPNICASCSSILDGMDDSKIGELKKAPKEPETAPVEPTESPAITYIAA